MKKTDKEREEKEKRKREKKEKKEKKKSSDKPLTDEELGRLEEAKRGLLHRLSDSAKHSLHKDHSSEDGVTPGGSNESLGSQENINDSSYTSSAKMNFTKTVKVPPPTRPKPKKGILKTKSTYGPEIPNQGVRGNLDDTLTLEENTLANELQIERMQQERQQRAISSGLVQLQQQKTKTVKNMAADFDETDGGVSRPTHKATSLKVSLTVGQQEPKPENGEEAEMSASPLPASPFSPSEKTYENVNLQLPNLAPPKCPKPREISLKRLPSGDYGFSLRRGTVLERGMDVDAQERKRTVIFAEPGPKNNNSGLLPGDRLVEVNGKSVENSSREEIVDLIRMSGNDVTLKVQPIPELIELSLRSGLEGEDVMIGEEGVKMGTLQRSGSMRFKSRPVSIEYSGTTQ